MRVIVDVAIGDSFIAEETYLSLDEIKTFLEVSRLIGLEAHILDANDEEHEFTYLKKE